MVPPLLLQPLVENSIKHGILPMKGKHGIVNIYIYERSEVLYIDVKDNGIGIEKAKENKSLHESFGLNNIQTRIEQLSIIQGKKLSFNIGGTKDDGGTLQWTVATITMPIS
jgi:sensor histidine kinase YesM